MRQLLEEMCARFEAPDGYSMASVDASQMAEMLDEIVGFQIQVREVKPRLKLSQNRSPEDWTRVKGQFAESPSPGPDLAEWMSRTRR
jgi:predicted FMN-binding regulatory protein PaiB